MGIESDGNDLALVTFEGMKEISSLGVPEFCGFVEGTGGNFVSE